MDYAAYDNTGPEVFRDFFFNPIGSTFAIYFPRPNLQVCLLGDSRLDQPYELQVDS